MGKHFSTKELEYIRDNYPFQTSQQIAKKLGRPNAKSIRNVAAELGIVKEKQWSSEEKRILALQYGHCDLEWLCRRLKRTRYSIMHMVRRLGIQKLKVWTSVDDVVLRSMLPTSDLCRVADALDTTVGSVIGRAQTLGIKHRRIPKKHPWKQLIGSPPSQ